MWLLWEEKVLIREIWLNIYLTEMLNSNRKYGFNPAGIKYILLTAPTNS